MLCFTDIDGVFALEATGHPKLNPKLVANLDTLIDFDPSIEVVFNTSWNIHSLAVLRARFAAAGFRHVEHLVGKTAGCGGGGALVKEWLRAQGRLGTPYILLDDSTRYGLMWGRLVHCHPKLGFTEERLAFAKQLVRRPVVPSEERRALLRNLSEEVARLIHETPWLTPAYRAEAMADTTALWNRAAAVPDDTLLREACLSP